MSEPPVGAGGSRSDDRAPASSAERPPRGPRGTDRRRIPRELEITEDERRLAQEYANPPAGHFLEGAYLLTRIKAWIADSGLLTAREKGFALAVAAHAKRDTGVCTMLSYADLADAMRSPRPRAKTTIWRRTAISGIADLEGLVVMETTPRWPNKQRDPARPRNWRNAFRLRFPPHAGEPADAQRDEHDPAAHAPADAQRDDEDAAAAHAPADAQPDEHGDVDARRSAERDAIEAEAAGREPQPAADGAGADEAAEPEDFFHQITRKQRGQSSASPPRPQPRPVASKPTPAASSAAAAPTELELAIAAAKLRSMAKGIAEILALHSKAFVTLPRDFAEKTAELVLREKHSLAKAANGIEQSLRKPGPRGRRLAAWVTACIVHFKGEPTASKAARQIVRRVEAELDQAIAALRSPPRGRAPP